MSHYLAIAIGPIYKTMSQARKSRQLWGSSYLFSFIMKNLLKNLYADTELGLKQEDILLPHAEESKLREDNLLGTGLYPDRLFIKDKNGHVARAISMYEQDIINKLISATGSKYRKFLENYLRIYYVSYTLPVPLLSEKPEENANIIWVGNKLLDSAELKEKYYTDITGIALNELIDKINQQLLYNDGFTNLPPGFHFPSVIEIATSEFERKSPTVYKKLVEDNLKEETEKTQEDFLRALDKSNAFGSLKVRSYHKYMAVVQADGDNIGKTIAAIGNDENMIQEFSKALLEFAKSSTDAIVEYGGKPVYVGGDDLFFFAPIAVRMQGREQPTLETIFDLIRKTDEIFKNKIINNSLLKPLYEKNIPTPSLSYGVSVTFTKFPLNEARDIAHHLLQKAKEKKDDKNKICFRVLRHSGQGFGFTVDKKKTDEKEPRSYDHFSDLCCEVPEDAPLLSSLIFKLAPLHKLIESAGKNKSRMKDLFDNTFNESVHKVDPAKTFLKDACNFISQVFEDFPNDNEGMPVYETEEQSSNLAKIYSTLRFLKMLVKDE